MMGLIVREKEGKDSTGRLQPLSTISRSIHATSWVWQSVSQWRDLPSWDVFAGMYEVVDAVAVAYSA